MRPFSHIRTYLRQPAARWTKTFALSALVGVLAGLAAAALEFGLVWGSGLLIGRFTHVGGASIAPQFDIGILLLPALGGLIGGLIVTWMRSPSRAHGTNQMVHAFHHAGGELGMADPTIKAVAAAGMISCGGSAGPEGPIAAVGAAIGSSVARLLKLSPQTRRVMLIAGCAGGVGAIFRCPLGGALFATSILYREPEFESDSIVPALVSSVISYSTFMAFWGYGHLLLKGVDKLVFTSATELLPYLVLGPVCALLSILLYYAMKTVEHVADHVPRPVAAALGGLLVGAIACVLPQIMDARYTFLQNILDGRATPEGAFLFNDPNDLDGVGVVRSWWAWTGMLGAIALLKVIASALTVGTAGAGGLLGPSVFIGGAGGAFVGAAIEAIYPGTFPVHLRQGLIAAGMGGVLAAAMRTPMAAIVMVAEMTGGYGLIVPLMLVCVTAYVIGRRWGLNTAQVRTLAESPAHAGDALVAILESYQVEDVVARNWPYRVVPSTSLGEMVAMLRPGTRPVFAVVTGDTLRGVVSVSDISRMLEEPGIADIVIASDMMSTELVVAHPDQNLYEVLETFRQTQHDVLPVVERESPHAFVGMLPRQAIHEAVRTRSQEVRSHLHREHAAVAAIEQDEQLYGLVMGLSPTQGDTIQRIGVPAEAVGQSIRDLDFRRRFGAQVIAVQRRDGSLECPPDIVRPLNSDELLLVISDAQRGGPGGAGANQRP